MTTRVVPFAERHQPAVEHGAEPVAVDPAERLVQPDGRPARRKKSAGCPQCGAGADRQVRSGIGATVSVTCENCSYEYPKESA